MLYYLSLFKTWWSPLNVFQYTTFRMGAAFLTALVSCLALGRPFIRWITRHGIGQTVRHDGPPSHLRKSGTPTMGGMLLFVSMIGAAGLWARFDNRLVLGVLGCAAYLWVLGFFDDYLKWVKGHPAGVSSEWKLFWQVLLGLLAALWLYLEPVHPTHGTAVMLPYLKDTFWPLGRWYIPFCLLVLVGSSNAVNLTDGLDGLAIGTLSIAALTYGVLAYVAGHAKFSQYLRIVPVAGAGELTIVLAAMAGAGLGFLWFNAYPAEIFMGDTGALFLGGVIGMVALFIKQELLLIVVGGVFVAEALSVLLQTTVFRMRGQRLFRMAPLHHHFELSGWAEPKVTIRFWIVGVLLSLLALFSLKLR